MFSFHLFLNMCLRARRKQINPAVNACHSKRKSLQEVDQIAKNPTPFWTRYSEYCRSGARLLCKYILHWVDCIFWLLLTKFKTNCRDPVTWKRFVGHLYFFLDQSQHRTLITDRPFHPYAIVIHVFNFLLARKQFAFGTFSG